MKNLLTHRLFEEEIADTEHYYGHPTCSQCMWFDESNEKCTFREYRRKNFGETKFKEGDGRDGTVFPSSDGCNRWYD